MCCQELKKEIEFSPILSALSQSQDTKTTFKKAAILFEKDKSLGLPTDVSRFETIRKWYIMARCWSATDLTRTSDRLPALAGLAAILDPWLQTRYIVGHWEWKLIRSLYWEVDQDAEALKHDGFNAPSWSWISALRKVTFCPASMYRLDDGTHEFSRVVDTRVTLSNEANPFGAVMEGALHLRGPELKHVQITWIYRHTIKCDITLPGDLSLEIAISTDHPSLESPDPVMKLLQPAGPDTVGAGAGAGSASPRLCWPSSLTLLPLVIDCAHRLRGLLLEKVDGGKSGDDAGPDNTFARVGTFRGEYLRFKEYPYCCRGEECSDRTKDFIARLPERDFVII